MNNLQIISEKDFPIQDIKEWENEIIESLKIKDNNQDIDVYSYLSKQNSSNITTKGYYTFLDTENINNLSLSDIKNDYNSNYNSVDIKLDYDDLKENKFDFKFLNEEINNYSDVNLTFSAKYVKELTNNSLLENSTILFLISDFFEQIDNKNILNNIKSITIEKTINTDFFCEIASLKSLRTLYHFVISQINKNTILSIPYLFIKTTSCENNKSILDYNNNLIRITIESLAAVIGGSDILESQSFDFDLSNDLNSELIFENLVNILFEESKVDRFEDITNGSYYLDYITNEFNYKTLDNLNLFSDISNLENKCEYIDEIIYKENQKIVNTFNKGYKSLIGVNKNYNNLGDKLELIDVLHSKENTLNLYNSIRFAKSFEEIKIKNNLNNINSETNNISLLCFGSKLDYIPRLDYAKDILGLVNLEFIETDNLDYIEDAINIAILNKSNTIAVCGTNSFYNDNLRYLLLEINKFLDNCNVVVFVNPKDINNLESLVKINSNLILIYKGVDLIEVFNKISN